MYKYNHYIDVNSLAVGRVRACGRTKLWIALKYAIMKYEVTNLF